MAVELAMPKPVGEPQVKGPEFNDLDRITDILTTEKHLANNYSVGLSEMQKPELRKVIQDVLKNTQDTQAQIFDQMFQKGWYKMKVADKQEIEAAKTQFSNYSSQFPQF
ncbi:spore coat protein [Paenibacillus psychroresistens]|uniref:Spore coat protein n=1 Tax=Paenibacillus psychroresistens TaxID=1778678 RepID=A0A6B8RKP6_9BACL|nr:spore coat protein [Paenibacillus psychroresistens]QGQ96981.1 spore coat protein [Paenibacillus psychroresistens]